MNDVLLAAIAAQLLSRAIVGKDQSPNDNPLEAFRWDQFTREHP